MRVRVWMGAVVVWVTGVGMAQVEGAGCTGKGAACAELDRQVRGMIAEPAVSRAHWGVMVEATDGTVLYGLNEGQFFQPASNAKLFTTAAAMALLGPERTFVTRVMVSGPEKADVAGDVVLVGGGDANLSERALPYVAVKAPRTAAVGAEPKVEVDPLRYLAVMADEVVAAGVKEVRGDVVGDDTVWPWEPYPEDWARDDLVWGYGAPVSALSVGDNQLRLTVTPGKAGEAAAVELRQAVPYYTVEAAVMTDAGKVATGGVEVERAAGSRVLRVYGRIAAEAGADVEEVAIADPAEYAAMAFEAMLEARGVVVRGRARALHRASEESVGFRTQAKEAMPADRTSRLSRERRPGGCGDDCDGQNHVGMREVARRTSPALGEDVVVTNKVSQNLHAELLLRQMGDALGDAGTAAQGARVVRWFLTTKAGVDPEDFVFYDGSGLSGHDLVTPRATVRLLTWASGQTWFGAWRSSLPVGGVDGTLESRFVKGPLAGKVFAKTGTMGEARALSGYVVGASGRTVAFSVMVTDHAPGGHADQEAMDRIVGAIAAAE